MLFNSFQFPIFFLTVVTLYFTIPYRYRWILLLGASYYFYMCWNPKYIILIIASTLIDYYAGIQMGKTEVKAERKKFLILSLTSNLGLLFSFKYFNFFNDSLKAAFDHYNIFYNFPAFNVLLPVGISFYTFQTLSYSIDIYRGEMEPEKHLGIFALYVAFFPQLVAGPIERSTHLLPQFYREIDFNYERVTNGLQLMLWGFFKKVVIADRLAVTVNYVYNNPHNFTGVAFVIATYFFAFQIYCDFSGYSDIAIGAARVMGIDIMENFKQPYFSKSISEFWKRWHISLSTWFKDYLYIPLGGNRVKKWRWYYNLMVVFLLSGLWHGANWTFLLWGALHGFYLVFAILTRPVRERFIQIIKLDKIPIIHDYLKNFTIFALVCFAWIFFRANSISDAFYIVSHLFTGWEDVFNFSRLRMPLDFGLSINELYIAVSSIGFLELVHFFQKRVSIRNAISEMPIYLRWTAYYALIFSIIIFGKFGSQQFIYFQF